MLIEVSSAAREIDSLWTWQGWILIGTIAALVAAVVSILVLKQGKHDRKTADDRYQVFKAKLQTPQPPG